MRLATEIDRIGRRFALKSGSSFLVLLVVADQAVAVAESIASSGETRALGRGKASKKSRNRRRSGNLLRELVNRRTVPTNLDLCTTIQGDGS